MDDVRRDVIQETEERSGTSEGCERHKPGVMTNNQTCYIFVSYQILLQPKDGGAVQLQGPNEFVKL